MSIPLVKAIDIVRTVSMLGLVAVFVRPHASWSLRARLPMALIVFVSSAILLALDIL